MVTMGFSQEELRKLFEQQRQILPQEELRKLLEQRQKQEAQEHAQTQAGLNMSVCVSLCFQLWFVVWNAATRHVLGIVDVGNDGNPLSLFTRKADTGGERSSARVRVRASESILRMWHFETRWWSVYTSGGIRIIPLQQ